MGKRTINIGMIGFGAMGKTHAYAVSNIPYFFGNTEFDAKIAALATTNIEKSSKICNDFGFGRAATVDEIINSPDIDVIDICVPNRLHFEIAEKAIKAGKHVLCEKPLCDNYKDAQKLAELAKASGLTCGTVFNNRFMSANIRAKQIIDEGRLGKILSFRFDYLHDSCIDPERSVGWKQTAEAGGGTLNDLGPHAIDLCRYMLGDFADVSCRLQIALPEHKTQSGDIWKTNADEAAYINAELKSGAVGNITLSKLCVGTNDGLNYEIYGTEGSLKFSLMEPNFLYFYDARQKQKPAGGYAGYTAIECVGRYPEPGGAFPSPKAPNGWLRGHVESMYRYLEAVYSGKHANPSFSDGAEAQKIIDLAKASSKENGIRKAYL